MPKGHPTSTAYSGDAETFQNDRTGTFTYASFPTGWYDAAQIDPATTSPKPSAVVINTTDAYGHMTQALATLPAVAESQGIYRPIDAADFYKTSADVRIDQLSDVDRSMLVEDPNNPGFLLCGCPVQVKDIVDWPMQVGFQYSGGTADLSVDPGPVVGMVASAVTGTWHLFAATPDAIADVDLGVQIELEKWYGVETDFDAPHGVLHGLLVDERTGATLADKTISLSTYGAYDPSVDGVFNVESFIDGEHSLLESSNPTLNRPGLAVIDNIDAVNPRQGNDHGFAYGQSHDATLVDYFACDRG